MLQAMIDTREAAELLGVSTDTVQNYIRRGTLRAVKYGDAPGSPVRIPSAEIARFLRAGERRARERAVA